MQYVRKVVYNRHMDIEQRLNAELNGKKVLVVGLGLQGGGLGLIKFLTHYGAIVTVTDLKSEEKLKKSIDALSNFSITFHLGAHTMNDFLQADIIFKAPKMRWDAPEIVAAEKKGVRIEMETSFFASMCPAPIIGITGTRGKSTTTHMIYEALQTGGKTVHLAGNIPQSPAIDLLTRIKKEDIVVLELSSWQLSGFHRKKISPHIGVFTNLYPDHLDYYHNMDEYFYDKSAIFAYQKKEDTVIANESLKNKVMPLLHGQHALFVTNDTFPAPLVNVFGDHIKQNAGAAFQAVKAVGIDDAKAIESISHFKGLSSRQQKVGEKNRILFINDTTSTTPIATEIALNTFHDYRIVLILGGNAKKLPYADLLKRMNKPESIVLLAGSFTDQILPQLKQTFPDKISEPFTDLLPAVTKAYEQAVEIQTKYPGEKVVVLFSPGATSFAMFNNEFHRGELFNSIVQTILESAT